MSRSAYPDSRKTGSRSSGRLQTLKLMAFVGLGVDRRVEVHGRQALIVRFLLRRNDEEEEVTMKRMLVAIVAVFAIVGPLAQSAGAERIDIWEKLFDCEGVFPISCPGPVP